MKTLTLEARKGNLDKVIQFIEEELEEAGCPIKFQMQIDVAVEELFINIANYAYAPQIGEARIEIDIQDGAAGTEVMIVFIDSGIPFDPTGREDPDVTLSAQERQIGGLGIFMAKKSVDRMEYAHTDGQNILRIYKRIG